MTGTIGRWWPPLLWMAVIFTLSAQPSLPRLAPSEWERLVTTAAHGGEYLVLGWLLARGFRGPRPALGGRLAIAAWAVAAFYGAGDELHQAFVPGRTPDAFDLLADAAGAALGVGLAAVRRAPAPSARRLPRFRP